MRRALLIGAAGLVLAVLAAIWIFWWAAGPKPGPHTIVVKEGATVGSVATAIQPRRLVLSHLIEAPAPVETEQYSLADLGKAVAGVKANYKGSVEVAADLQCYPIGASH